MEKIFGWKKTTAFLMSAALAAAAMPVNAGGLFKANTGIVASAAAEAKAPAVGTLFKVGDTIAVTGETWFVVDDDSHSGDARAKIESDLTITGYESSDADNQYIWKTGDVELMQLHNGFYITRKDPSADPEGFYITGGKGTYEDPFIIGLTAPKFSARNIALNDGICMNFIVGEVNDNNKDDLRVKLSGDCAEADDTLRSLDLKTVDGDEVYCVTANVTANNMSSVITAELYYGDSETPIDSYAFSVNDYLDIVDTTGNEKLEALVNATKQYGSVSAAYFGDGALPEVNDHSDEILNSTYSFGEYSFNLFKPSMVVYGDTVTMDTLEPGDALISLVLNSKLAVRLYLANYDENASNLAGAEPMGKVDEYFNAEAIKGADDKYCFDIPGITPTLLGQQYDVNYLGTHYFFSPMSWAYRVMSNDGASAKNVAMANALYEYYAAATAYVS